jgi:hypothetical protein
MTVDARGTTSELPAVIDRRYKTPEKKIGLVGFEPTASATRTQRSTKLSHSPWQHTMAQFRAGSSLFILI